MDISDTDMVLMGNGQGAYIYSFSTIEDEIYVYRKQGTTWSRLLKYTNHANPGFGGAVDIEDDLIAVGGENGVDFFGTVGNTLDPINSIESDPVRLVAINGEYAAGVEEGQSNFIWQYHHSPAEGGYCKSGTMGGGVDTIWTANNLNISGNRVLSGYKGYNSASNNLIGSVIFDSVHPLYSAINTMDDAEGERILRNSGPFGLPVTIRFRYVADGGYRGDIGLDNIAINRNSIAGAAGARDSQELRAPA